jgi:hypothetical protein
MCHAANCEDIHEEGSAKSTTCHFHHLKERGVQVPLYPYCLPSAFGEWA